MEPKPGFPPQRLIYLVWESGLAQSGFNTQTGPNTTADLAELGNAGFFHLTKISSTRILGVSFKKKKNYFSKENPSAPGPMC